MTNGERAAHHHLLGRHVVVVVLVVVVHVVVQQPQETGSLQGVIILVLATVHSIIRSDGTHAPRRDAARADARRRADDKAEALLHERDHSPQQERSPQHGLELWQRSTS